MIDSPIADMQNISSGRGAGSITAGQFLQRFIQDGVKWAHLDIAGAAWPAAGMANGFGVRWLDRFIRNNYETAVPGKLQAQAPAKPSP
jgi:leucyl aminopeptidase